MSRPVEVLDELEAVLVGPAPGRLRIGVALPLSGHLGQVGPSALEAVLLAGSELQAARGDGERPLEFVVVDAGRAPQSVGQAVAGLAHSGNVDAFVGLHTSDALDAVVGALGGADLPYVFTAGHENARRPSGFVDTGESPEELAFGLGRVMRERAVDTWALVGSDYVWPRAMRSASRAVIEEHGGVVTLDRLVPLGEARSSGARLLREVEASGVQGLVLSMPGRELITMLSAVSALQLDKRMIVYSGSLEENALYALGGNRSGNVYAMQHSFESLASDRRRELNEKFVSSFGENSPVLNSWAEHCYDGVHLVAELERRGLLRPSNRQGAEESSTMSEIVELRPRYDTHLAVAEGMTFQVL